MSRRKTRKRTIKRTVPVRVNRAVKTARRRRSRKGGLSDAFTPSSAKSAATDMVKGVIGGGVTAVIEKGVAVVTTGTNGKLISTIAVIGGAFIAHAVMKQPAVSAGMMGAKAYAWAKEIPMLNDDASFADPDILAEPDFMSEDGTPYYMSEDGVLMSADEMADEMADEFADFDEDFV